MINWKIRFTKDNISFILRFFVSLFIPILIYLGIEAKDLTTWQALGDVLIRTITNPYLVGLTVINAINILFDPTTEGLGDSLQAMQYVVPKKRGKNNGN